MYFTVLFVSLPWYKNTKKRSFLTVNLHSLFCDAIYYVAFVKAMGTNLISEVEITDYNKTVVGNNTEKIIHVHNVDFVT